MQTFDLRKMKVFPYEERQKNIFYQSEEFKTIMVELPAGGEIPRCEMEPSVVFVVLAGSAEITVNQQKAILQEGQCLITEPATLSMKTSKGVKIMGIQIFKK